MKKGNHRCKVCGEYFGYDELRAHNAGVKDNPCYVPRSKVFDPNYVPTRLLTGTDFMAIGPGVWGRADTQVLAIKRMREKLPGKRFAYKVYQVHLDSRINEKTGALQYPIHHPPVLVYETSPELWKTRAAEGKKIGKTPNPWNPEAPVTSV